MVAQDEQLNQELYIQICPNLKDLQQTNRLEVLECNAAGVLDTLDDQLARLY